MVDIRKKFIETLQKWGHYVIYIRRDLRFRCPCFIERSGEASEHCPKCFGTGYRVTIEKHLTRQHPNSVPLSLSGLDRSTPYGNIVPNANVYYFDYTVEPKSGDLIIEVDWNGDTPMNIKFKQLISLSEPKYGQQGRVEYYSCYAKFTPKGDNDHVTSIPEH